MKVAVVGCSHGKLNTIYERINEANRQCLQKGESTVELLICCGDFQAMRNHSDLETFKAPDQYRVLNDFHDYYAGRKQAPVLTLVVGGNHEAMGYFRECLHGGWLAPSIYYLGFAGCVIVDGWMRVAGSSGIYESRSYHRGHYEDIPFPGGDVVTAYHTREFDIARLLMLENYGPKIDIFMAHEWPRGIEKYGNKAALLKAKPGFTSQMQAGTMFSPPFERLLHTLKPSLWFSGHHHTRFDARVVHGNSSAENDRSGSSSSSLSPQTRFLALSKPGVGEWFDIIDIPDPHSATTTKPRPARTPTLFFDPHWLAVVRAFDPYLPLDRTPPPRPKKEQLKSKTEESFGWVRENVLVLGEDGKRRLRRVLDVQQFEQTAEPTTIAPPSGGAGDPRAPVKRPPPPQKYENPQTRAFCQLLSIPFR